VNGRSPQSAALLFPLRNGDGDALVSVAQSGPLSLATRREPPVLTRATQCAFAVEPVDPAVKTSAGSEPVFSAGSGVPPAIGRNAIRLRCS